MLKSNIYNSFLPKPPRCLNSKNMSFEVGGAGETGRRLIAAAMKVEGEERAEAVRASRSRTPVRLDTSVPTPFVTEYWKEDKEKRKKKEEEDQWRKRAVPPKPGNLGDYLRKHGIQKEEPRDAIQRGYRQRLGAELSLKCPTRLEEEGVAKGKARRARLVAKKKAKREEKEKEMEEQKEEKEEEEEEEALVPLGKNLFSYLFK